MSATTSRAPSATFRCRWPRCSKAFTRKFNLDTHQLAHCGEKPFACLSCKPERRFTRLNDLKVHDREKHGPGEAQRFACTLCGREFDRRANKVRHERNCNARDGENPHQTLFDAQINPLREVAATFEGHSSLSSSFISMIGNSNRTVKRTKIQGVMMSSSASSLTPTVRVGNASGRLWKPVGDGPEWWESYILETCGFDVVRAFDQEVPGQEIKETPTWVLDTTCGSGLLPTHDILRRARPNACGNRTSVDSIPGRHSRYLKFRGVEFDTVKDVSISKGCEEADWQKPPFGLAVSWQSFFQKSETYAKGELLADVLACVLAEPLLHQQLMAKTVEDPLFLDGAGSAFRNWLAEVQLAYLPKITIWPPPSAALIEKKELWTSEMWSLWSRGFITWGNRLGSDSGCDDNARPGDICCVLFGCAVPLILRPVRGHFLLIGCAYIHGVMKGEIIDGLDAGKFQERIFEIC